MKRDLKPFVVEVKRGKRRPSFLGQFEDKTTTMNEATRRAELALFTAPPGDTAAAQMKAQESAGRILPSLIEPEPADEIVLDDPAPRRRGRKPGSKNKPKLHSAGEVEETGRTVAKRPAPNPATAIASWLAEPDEPAETRPAAPLVEAVRADVPGSGPTRQRLRDRSTILARYVHGTAPGPGEGWSRWARKGHRRARSASAE